MRKLFAITAVAAMICLTAIAPAHAFHCPADMKAIDAALAKHPKVSKADMTEIMSLRAKGEALHKSGQHGKSVATLGQAMKLLRLK